MFKSLASCAIVIGAFMLMAVGGMAQEPPAPVGSDGEEETNAYPTQACADAFKRWSMHEQLLASAYFFLDSTDSKQRALKSAIREKYLLTDLGDDEDCLYGN